MGILAQLTELPDGHDHQWADMDKRYGNTYMLYEDKEIIFYQGKDRQNLIFNTLEDRTVSIGMQEEANLKAFLPRTGYYNINNTPMLVLRQPKRQWKRSFCSSVYMVVGQNNRDTSWGSVARAMLNPQYASLDDITIALFGNVALSHNFAVYKEKNTHVLAFRRYVVAQLDFDKKHVLVLQPQLVQEVMDLFKHTGVSKWKLVQTAIA